MYGWIEVTNLKTGRHVLINTDRIISIAPLLQSGKANGFVQCTDGYSVVTEENYSYLMDLIKDSYTDD